MNFLFRAGILIYTVLFFWETVFYYVYICTADCMSYWIFFSFNFQWKKMAFFLLEPEFFFFLSGNEGSYASVNGLTFSPSKQYSIQFNQAVFYSQTPTPQINVHHELRYANGPQSAIQNNCSVRPSIHTSLLIFIQSIFKCNSNGLFLFNIFTKPSIILRPIDLYNQCLGMVI